MKASFSPIINCSTHSLFLGTLPGEVSLTEQKYYAHPQNKFWKLVYEVFQKNYDEDYEIRIEVLLNNGFGLWDVLSNGEREGSLDSAIKNYEINDFKKLKVAFPALQTLYFTSKQAYQWYYKTYKEQLSYRLVILASPSPANARLTYEEKLYDWKRKIIIR